MVSLSDKVACHGLSLLLLVFATHPKTRFHVRFSMSSQTGDIFPGQFFGRSCGPTLLLAQSINLSVELLISPEARRPLAMITRELFNISFRAVDLA
jgi:hypothetical protein